jgi:glycosyltransferase involved in cell wall biosynthesis
VASQQRQSPPTDSARVAILLSTYNGESFLAEQLDSLITQTHSNWTIFASDDGSSDTTLEVLTRYQTILGADRLTIIEGPRKGFAANFLSLLANSAIDAQYFAFCDQDDLWHPDRLSTGLSRIRDIPADRPALFCSRTQLIDSGGHPIGLSPLFHKPPCFENALVQSIAGGNTMLFNAAARDLIRRTDSRTRIVSHDWWAYILVSGCGGVVAYEQYPTIGYRQHDHNIVGSNLSVANRLVRLRKMFQGTFRTWTDDNLHALRPLKPFLTPHNQRTLELFEQGRSSPLPTRLKLMFQSGVHRQTIRETLGLAAAAILHRI